jgi:hypothetical protein
MPTSIRHTRCGFQTVTTAPRPARGGLMGGPAQELFWRRERAHPVGSTALQFTQPDRGETDLARLEDAADNGAQVFCVTEDPGTWNLSCTQKRPVWRVVRGMYELLAEQFYCDLVPATGAVPGGIGRENDQSLHSQT